ncbi:MAG TPA: hypothetical protein VF723_08285 [Pyrinomonadaceae bacterium]|jgi:hypothetical protein
MGRPVPRKIATQLRKWSLHARVLRISHAVLVTIATLCSVLVAARLNPFQAIPLEWIAATATISLSLMNALDLGSKSNRMRKGWRRLYAATIRFEENPKTPEEKESLNNLIKVYEEAEDIIGDVKEDPS